MSEVRVTNATKTRRSKPSGITSALVETLAIRGIALGGRFIFVIFAAKLMTPSEFGRFGLLQALALIVSGIVGLEAYQVLLRRIQHASNPEADQIRHAYGCFALWATAVAAAFALIFLFASGWRGIMLLFGVLVVAGEHISTETYRNLVNEHRPQGAVLSVAMRTGIWGAMIPGLDLLHVLPRPWPLEMVLLIWLVGIVFACGAGWPLWRSFRPQWPIGAFQLPSVFQDVLRQSRWWIPSTLGCRVVENGGRFAAAWMISEAAAGRFTLLGTLASIAYVGHKGVIEPIYFAKLLQPDQVDTGRNFRLITIIFAIIGALASCFAWGSVLYMRNETPSLSDMFAFGGLLVTYTALTISQIPHFKLYRSHVDRTIALANVAGAAVAGSAYFLLGKPFGLAGICAATAAGALVILVTKVVAAHNLSPVRHGEKA